jgi:hypothetical protein
MIRNKAPTVGGSAYQPGNLLLLSKKIVARTISNNPITDKKFRVFV